MAASKLPTRNPTGVTHPIINPLDELIGYSLNQAARTMMLEFSRRMMELGLGTSSASVLLVIHANPGITQSQLCFLLGIQRANMTPLMRTLEQRALVSKQSTNSRRQALSITPAGTQLCKQVKAVIDEFEEVVFASLPATQHERMLAGVKSISAAFRSSANSATTRTSSPGKRGRRKTA